MQMVVHRWQTENSVVCLIQQNITIMDWTICTSPFSVFKICLVLCLSLCLCLIIRVINALVLWSLTLRSMLCICSALLCRGSILSREGRQQWEGGFTEHRSEREIARNREEDVGDPPSSHFLQCCTWASVFSEGGRQRERQRKWERGSSNLCHRELYSYNAPPSPPPPLCLFQSLSFFPPSAVKTAFFSWLAKSGLGKAGFSPVWFLDGGRRRWRFEERDRGSDSQRKGNIDRIQGDSITHDSGLRSLITMEEARRRRVWLGM